MSSHGEVLDALTRVTYPGLTQDIVTFGMVKDLAVDGGRVQFVLDLPTPSEAVRDRIVAAVTDALSGVPGVVDADVKILLPAEEPGADLLAARRAIAGVGTTIAVASGKGGVGKSTLAVNLALALAGTGAQVGLLDADIHGPNLPLMLGLAEPPMAIEGRYVPVRRHGLRVISRGLLAGAADPVIWRGALVMEMVRKFLRSVFWGGVDYLVIDLPPGTGDAQLTLVQEIPLTGAVIVTTPQDVALLDARKAFEMFRRTGVRVLGLVENMSALTCPHCAAEVEVFGQRQGRRLAEALEIPFLGEIPLDAAIRRAGDSGRPMLLDDPEAPRTRAFRDIAERVLAELTSRETRP
jgi:ATP-binding protein involved in chromosome partitioning